MQRYNTRPMTKLGKDIKIETIINELTPEKNGILSFYITRLKSMLSGGKLETFALAADPTLAIWQVVWLSSIAL